MKLAFIVQRYGREILGGAETLTRQIAERVARRHEIDVLTTTARDYITWRNEYPAGEEKLRGVRIRRFSVASERNLEEFNRFSDWIYANPHTREDELRWLDMQGPISHQLIDFLRREHGRYELLVFFTYLYYPTFYGLQIAPERSALVPTAHDEPPLRLGIYKEVFEAPVSLIFNTESEELLVLERFHVHKRMRETIGIGMELLDIPDAAAFRRKYKLPGRFLLYAGRIDAGKGCEDLIRFFRLYKDEHPEAGHLQLVLMGSLSMKLPPVRDVRYLGFLDEEDKFTAMAAATTVVIPSRLESLSIAALEAFSVGTPVVASAGSRVLVEHCRKANAGLYYSDYDEFEAILDVLLEDKTLSRNMGRQGQKYIKDNFGWDKLLPQYELAFRSAARPPRPALPFREKRLERPRRPPRELRVEAEPAPLEEAVQPVESLPAETPESLPEAPAFEELTEIEALSEVEGAQEITEEPAQPLPAEAGESEVSEGPHVGSAREEGEESPQD